VKSIKDAAIKKAQELFFTALLGKIEDYIDYPDSAPAVTASSFYKKYNIHWRVDYFTRLVCLSELVPENQLPQLLKQALEAWMKVSLLENTKMLLMLLEGVDQRQADQQAEEEEDKEEDE